MPCLRRVVCVCVVALCIAHQPVITLPCPALPCPDLFPMPTTAAHRPDTISPPHPQTPTTANPAFFKDETPCVLPAMNALAVEVWTTNGGIRMDNFVVGHDAAAALAYIDQAWKRESCSCLRFSFLVFWGGGFLGGGACLL
jgi:hypothetical protein